MKGLVMRSTGSWYEVLTDEGKTIACRVRGKLRLEGIKETNPIAVGDYVSYDLENEEARLPDGQGIIHEILPRKNYLVRQSVKKTGHTHVLAANIDQAMVVVTLAFPRTSLGFIDRFLVSAEAFRIPQIIVFNKKDLLDTSGLDTVAQLTGLYRSIGIECLSVSAIHEDVEAVKKLLQDKVTLVAGHSGVGKSTLLNKISPAIDQTIGDVSEFSSKGTHTTTFAEMFQLDVKTFVVDTPGVKELGLVDMSEQEISDYFPEMREVRLGCKFGARCLHLNEPKCAVLDAVKEGRIFQSRYDSYVSMMRGEDNRK